MHNIHSGDITKEEYTNVPIARIIHIFFHELAVCERGTK